MAFIEWDPGYSVNIKLLDEQHQLLVKMINDLYNAYQKGHEKAELEKIIGRMSSYAAFHFAREEHYFEMFGYPMTAAHEREHLDFEKKVGDFEDNFKSGRQTLSNDIFKFLSDWLVNHIQNSDKQYVSFLNKRGIK